MKKSELKINSKYFAEITGDSENFKEAIIVLAKDEEGIYVLLNENLDSDHIKEFLDCKYSSTDLKNGKWYDDDIREPEMFDENIVYYYNEKQKWLTVLGYEVKITEI